MRAQNLQLRLNMLTPDDPAHAAITTQLHALQAALAACDGTADPAMAHGPLQEMEEDGDDSLLFACDTSPAGPEGYGDGEDGDSGAADSGDSHTSSGKEIEASGLERLLAIAEQEYNTVAS